MSWTYHVYFRQIITMKRFHIDRIFGALFWERSSLLRHSNVRYIKRFSLPVVILRSFTHILPVDNLCCSGPPKLAVTWSFEAHPILVFRHISEVCVHDDCRHLVARSLSISRFPSALFFATSKLYSSDVMESFLIRTTPGPMSPRVSSAARNQP